MPLGVLHGQQTAISPPLETQKRWFVIIFAHLDGKQNVAAVNHLSPSVAKPQIRD